MEASIFNKLFPPSVCVGRDSAVVSQRDQIPCSPKRSFLFSSLEGASHLSSCCSPGLGCTASCIGVAPTATHTAAAASPVASSGGAAATVETPCVQAAPSTVERAATTANARCGAGGR
eukprot:6211374-Pleurochrysis_carterae.AAC.1